MALKKPSDYFKKTSTVDTTIQQVIKQPEVNTFSDAFESFKSNLNKIETLSNFTETLDNYRVNIERVNHISSKVEELQEEIQNTLKKEDLNQALMAQLLVVEQSIQEVQSKVKSINQETVTEIKTDVSLLTDSVYEFLELEVPKYKKLIVDSELRTDNRFTKFENSINETLEGIGEFVDNKYQELTENLQGINETSLSSILEDFKFLETQLQQLKEEDIPRYKGLIVETERKTESKLNDYDEKLTKTLSTVDNSIFNVLEKLNLVELEKAELVNEVTQTLNQLSSQVTEELKNNQQIKEKVTDLETNIVIYDKHLKSYSKELNEKVNHLENNILLNNKNLKFQNQNLKQIQEKVKETLSKINLEEIEKQNYDLGKKVKYLEEVFAKFNEKEILTENLLAEPPSTTNKDPLTPLDQNFVTLEQLQQHYRLFINRIQQQLSTLGGGGETQLKYLDDVVGIATNASAYDGKFLKYNHSIQKFEFDTVNQGTTDNIVTNSVSIVDNDSTTNYSGEVVTLQKTYTAVTQSTTPASIHKLLPVVNYSTVEYFIQATSGLDIDTRKIITVNNQTLINKTEIASVSTGTTFATYDININDGLIDLIVTPLTSNTVVYSISYTAFVRTGVLQFQLTDENDNVILTENDEMLIAEAY